MGIAAKNQPLPKLQSRDEHSDKNWRDYFKFERKRYHDDERRRKFVEDRQVEQDKLDRLRREKVKAEAQNNKLNDELQKIRDDGKQFLAMRSGMNPSSNIIPTQEATIASSSETKGPTMEEKVAKKYEGMGIFRMEPLSQAYRDLLAAPVSQPLSPPPPPPRYSVNAKVAGALAAGLVAGGLVTWAWRKLRSRKSREEKKEEEHQGKLERRHPRQWTVL